MLVKNCAGAEIIPFPGACRGGCSLGWRWSDTLLIAASGEFGEILCGKVNFKAAVAKLFSCICSDCPDKYFFENNPYRQIQMRSGGVRDHSLWACP